MVKILITTLIIIICSIHQLNATNYDVIYIFPVFSRTHTYHDYHNGSKKTNYFGKTMGGNWRRTTADNVFENLIPTDYGISIGYKKYTKEHLYHRFSFAFQLQQSAGIAFFIDGDIRENTNKLPYVSSTSTVGGQSGSTYTVKKFMIEYATLIKQGKTNTKFTIDKEIGIGFSILRLSKYMEDFILVKSQKRIFPTEIIYQPNFFDNDALSGEVYHSKERNTGYTISISLGFQFKRNNKDGAKVDLIYSQGLAILYKENIDYTIRHTKHEGHYNDTVVTRGSNISVVLSYPIILKKL